MSDTQLFLDSPKIDVDEVLRVVRIERSLYMVAMKVREPRGKVYTVAGVVNLTVSAGTEEGNVSFSQAVVVGTTVCYVRVPHNVMKAKLFESGDERWNE